MFHYCQLWHPPKDWRIFFSHGIFGVGISLCCLHMWKNSSPKDPQKKWYSKSTNRCSCEKQRGKSSHNFDSLPRVEYLLFQHESFCTCYQLKSDFVPKIPF